MEIKKLISISNKNLNIKKNFLFKRYLLTVFFSKYKLYS